MPTDRPWSNAMPHQLTNTRRLSRRAFLHRGSLFLLAAGAGPPVFADDQVRPPLRIGLVTDLHYADKPPAGTRHYRETLDKLAEAAERFAADKPDFLVELGDFIDAADSVETEQRYLKRIHGAFTAIPGPKHYVLGNHCVDTLTKQEFLDGVGQDQARYSFDRGGWHFVVLDACFRSDGTPYGRKNSQWTDTNVPAAELEWLAADLAGADKPTIVFTHQRLDETKQHSARNAADVRRVLEGSRRVRAVLQGHSHKNDHQEIAGIHYGTLVAMVEGSGAENNGYSLLDVLHDGSLRVSGFRQQSNYQWS
jgi:alkaline phosphatase